MTTGQRIKDLRKSRGLRQIELSEKTGLSTQVISNIERGYSKPNDTQIRLIADALNVSTYEILDGDFSKEIIPLMFKDKSAFDSLPGEKQQEIMELLKDQADFLIEREIRRQKMND
ncbi:helix-turn-helix domain-containing protein [Staphylococcus hyicus]|uniref:helix-turn-helix domain-containing protein n=1 Tax=Staphylococcus hyicus TaxID=1284 RepID=UPI00211CE2DB|nr:helix-turn-helix transcriptional regulator [Staphylococcus hyicus]MCQ9290653.1 helix-turn-helix domain-containing protein [Staphylococcus hyicus]MCQ9305895.1 helix-turn-helix domain-containing protein [Staphylococcus hyicus]MCQ9308307.1 helix-turn-helix domain-containing protein [Staphylococcus hyicus]MCQ9310729.1 helix-turn-helix domain-containing protein [Staphylococcus hyicus]